MHSAILQVQTFIFWINHEKEFAQKNLPEDTLEYQITQKKTYNYTLHWEDLKAVQHKDNFFSFRFIRITSDGMALKIMSLISFFIFYKLSLSKLVALKIIFFLSFLMSIVGKL